jgi:hypothetical protein
MESYKGLKVYYLLILKIKTLLFSHFRAYPDYFGGAGDPFV